MLLKSFILFLGLIQTISKTKAEISSVISRSIPGNSQQCTSNSLCSCGRLLLLQMTLELDDLFSKLQGAKDQMEKTKADVVDAINNMNISDSLLKNNQDLNDKDKYDNELKPEEKATRASASASTPPATTTTTTTAPPPSSPPTTTTTATTTTTTTTKAPPVWPKDCYDVFMNGNKTSGVYTVVPHERHYEVWCDMDYRGGGWTVFLNRYDGSVNFRNHWLQYKNGFGNLLTEFWLGLEPLYEITFYRKSKLAIQMFDYYGHVASAFYNHFGIENASDQYRLTTLGDFSSVPRFIKDDLRAHFNAVFSTVDSPSENERQCAKIKKGGFWWNDCMKMNPVGLYFENRVLAENEATTGIHWNSFSGYTRSLKAIRMLIKPENIEDTK